MTDKPKMNAPNYQAIPQEMKDLSHWVNWKYYWDESQQRWTKLPLNPITGTGAKQNDPATWGTFSSSCGHVWNNPDLGLGFEIGSKAAGRSSGLFCVDLDHVLENGKIEDAAAREIFETLDSYTEISPGGDGLHIWIKADVTEERRKRVGPIEMYGDGRYITVTGNLYGTRTTIEERTAEINELIDKYLTAEPKPPPSSVATNQAAPAAAYDPWAAAANAGTSWAPDTDDDIIRKMCDRNPDAAALWKGDMSSAPKKANGTPDQSAADQALTNHLAYWANYDAATVDRLFRRSGLMRDKWDKLHDPAHNRTYGQMTIDNALAGKTPRTVNNAAPSSSSSSVGTSQQSAPGPQPSQSAAPNAAPGPQQQPQDDVYFYSAAQARTDFEDMILVKTPRISTGFPYLNMLLDGGLYPSLITLGAVTSAGKTTLGLQMMDNIAAAGHDVLIFSLEMSRFELIAKSISRLGFKKAIDKNDAFTTRQLLNYDDYKNYSEARLLLMEKSKREYFEDIAPHVFIREALGDMDIMKMRNIMTAHCDQTGAAPVVLVDYIQLLAPPPNRRNMTDKQVLDFNIMSLKQISRDFNTPVIAISSLNRQAYTTRGTKTQGTGSSTGQQTKDSNRVTLADFKESGAIEYSSDILLGLNRESYDAVNKKGNMALDILKNRNGEKDTSQAFDYHYRFNCLIEVNRGTNAPKP